MTDRDLQLIQVLEQVATRRLSGEQVVDSEIIDKHPELMPELEHRLCALQHVEDTRRASWTRAHQGATLKRDMLPGYDLLEELHRGGQGVVYAAMQQRTRRRVAIKVLREGGLATDVERARFRREVRILGQLNHPHIVDIHDSGELEGCFYFVMDLVDGKPVDEYVKRCDLPIKTTLKIFATICDAVHAAHQRGVIHRDLKPHNVLIDAAGEPHVLDFGLAKLEDGGSPFDSESRAMTASGQFVGSLPWASPEQVRGGVADIDVRSDVYSLGVMLYQVLTEQFPYPVTGPLREVLDNILEATPVRPSTSRRGIDNEVETILLKCLDKNPERRYQSAVALAADIGRYLSGEPVEAKRDSRLYVLRKRVWHHKVPIGVMVGFMVLIAGFVRTRMAASQEIGHAAASVTIGLSLLESGEPFDANIPLLEQVEHLADLVERHVRDDRQVGDLRGLLGQAYIKLGAYPEAEDHLTRAVEALERIHPEPHEDLAAGHYGLARVLVFQNKYPQAEIHYQRALDIHRSLHADPHLDIAKDLNGLAVCLRRQGRFAEAEQGQRRVLAQYEELLGDRDPRIASGLNNLAVCLKSQGRFGPAEHYYRQAVQMAEQLELNPLYIAKGYRNIAVCRLAIGDHTAARELLLTSREILEPKVASDHPELAAIDIQLALCAYDAGSTLEARTQARDALDRQLQKFAEPHTVLASSMALLGTIDLDIGEPDVAEPLLLKALAMRRALIPDHPDVAGSLQQLAMLELARGDLAAAGGYGTEAIERHRDNPGEPREVSAAHGVMAIILVEEGDGVAAIRHAQLAQDAIIELMPDDHWQVAQANAVLGACLLAARHDPQGQRLLITGLSVLRTTRGTSYPVVRWAQEVLDDHP